MADRYPEKPFPAGDDYDRGGRSRASSREESDPLAELARLIGKNDQYALGRANLPFQQQPRQPDSYDQEDQYDLPPEPDEDPPRGPPSWMQRVARQEPEPEPQQEYPSAVHPVQRYAATSYPPEADHDEADGYEEQAEYEPDLSRYDDALYGGLDADGQESAQHDQAYADDGYAYQEEFDEGAQEPKRRGRLITVIAVLALAVFGVGGAYAYRTYVGSARSGEPPIIRADNGPTKIVPTPPEAGAKVPDRLSMGDGTEKIVPREEAPVDLNRSGPRVVFPPPNTGSFPPATATAAPASTTVANAGNAGNGTMPNSEPRKIRTFTVRGDQGDAGSAAAPPPAAAPAPTPAKPAANAKAAGVPKTPPSVANANANAPISLAPQTAQPAPAPAAEPPATRVATTAPTQAVPAQPPSGGGAAPATGSTGGGYLVQVSSQRSEADAQASYKALQNKFPSVLGSHTSVIKRADLGDKGVYYRAMVGPFNSSDEASQFCGSLKSAGGQCVIQRN
jgi:SPOR domain